jgi:hypothetical protein
MWAKLLVGPQVLSSPPRETCPAREAPICIYAHTLAYDFHESGTALTRRRVVVLGETGTQSPVVVRPPPGLRGGHPSESLGPCFWLVPSTCVL